MIRAKLSQYDKRESTVAYLFLLPLLLTILAFVFVPVIGTFVNSLYSDISINKILAPGDGVVRIGQYVEVYETQADDDGSTIEEYERYYLPVDAEPLVANAQRVETGAILGGSEVAELSGQTRLGLYLDYRGDNGFNKKLRLKPGQNQLYVSDGERVESGQELVSQAWFVGLKNYGELLQDGQFWGALRFTLLFTVTSVLLEVLLAMGFAVLLHQTFPGRGMLRAIILIPWVIPTIISAKTWGFMYNYEYGLFNWIGMNWMGMEKIDWSGTATSAFWAIVLTDTWKTTPFIVIILLAGLQAIPQDLYKQARVDGCGMFKSFFKITLPLVMPVLIVSLIFRTVDALRIFDLVYVLTGGGPSDSTQTLSTIGYQYFVNKSDFGMGSTVSFVTFLVGFAIALIYIKAGRFSQSIR